MRNAGTEEIDMHTTQSIAIRRATPDDQVALERLAALDSAPAPSGEVLIAEVGDEPQAAMEVATGTTIADPFRPTADLVELLTLRAVRLRGATPPRRRLRLRPRSAYRTA
jgi:hypothetical protein